MKYFAVKYLGQVERNMPMKLAPLNRLSFHAYILGALFEVGIEK